MVNGLALHRHRRRRTPARRLTPSASSATEAGAASARPTAPSSSSAADAERSDRPIGTVSTLADRARLAVFCHVFSNPRPRSSGDRASASGAVCAGSNPAEGAAKLLVSDPFLHGRSCSISCACRSTDGHLMDPGTTSREERQLRGTARNSDTRERRSDTASEAVCAGSNVWERYRKDRAPVSVIEPTPQVTASDPGQPAPPCDCGPKA